MRTLVVSMRYENIFETNDFIVFEIAIIVILQNLDIYITESSIHLKQIYDFGMFIDRELRSPFEPAIIDHSRSS